MPKRESKEKKSRKVGTNLFLKGERSFSQKAASVRRPYPPGVHGKRRRFAQSEFGQQLLEKQKIKWSYGLRETQFKNYYTKASKNPGATGQIFIQQLERRLDNVVYRLGFAVSRSIARHLVSHGHIHVNGRKVTIPSFQVYIGDVIKVRPESRKDKQFEELSNTLKKLEVPEWLHLEREKEEGKVVKLPLNVELPFNVNLVVDFYSR